MKPTTVTTRRTWGLQDEAAFDVGVAGLAIGRLRTRDLGQLDAFPWAVIHVRSGLEILSFEDPETDVKACQDLEACDIDWSRPAREVASDPRARDAARLVKAQLGGIQGVKPPDWCGDEFPGGAS